MGATGIAQAIEIFEQLRGDSGQRQVKDARTGLIQNMGGSGAEVSLEFRLIRKEGHTGILCYGQKAIPCA